ncbi:MAG TPA: hypothetical protein VFI27_19955, partial [candidate division Zixibacteria bacterium]|nr:hypothetical protein [candidate division Zixibacteria bacterium]
AVKKHFEREQKMLTEHGASVFFQVYRLNLQADTLEELQGKKLAEIKVDGSFGSSTASVAVVKDMVRALLMDKERKRNNGQAPVGLAIEAADRLTLYLGGRPLQDDTAFYDDNCIMLPVWIQVLLHRCESEEAVQLINKLQK